MESDGDLIEDSGSIVGDDKHPNLSIMELLSDSGDIDLTLLPASI